MIYERRCRKEIIAPLLVFCVIVGVSYLSLRSNNNAEILQGGNLPQSSYANISKNR